MFAVQVRCELTSGVLTHRFKLLSFSFICQRALIRHLAVGKSTCHLSVSLPLDESFGSCLMPSRADVNVTSCHIDELIDGSCSSSPTVTVTSSAPSATEVVSLCYLTSFRFCLLLKLT